MVELLQRAAGGLEGRVLTRYHIWGHRGSVNMTGVLERDRRGEPERRLERRSLTSTKSRFTLLLILCWRAALTC